MPNAVKAIPNLELRASVFTLPDLASSMLFPPHNPLEEAHQLFNL